MIRTLRSGGRAEVPDDERKLLGHVLSGNFGGRLQIDDADIIMGANFRLRRTADWVGHIEQVHRSQTGALRLRERANLLRQAFRGAAGPIAVHGNR